MPKVDFPKFVYKGEVFRNAFRLGHIRRDNLFLYKQTGFRKCPVIISAPMQKPDGAYIIISRLKHTHRKRHHCSETTEYIKNLELN